MSASSDWEQRAQFYEQDAAAAWEKCEEHRLHAERMERERDGWRRIVGEIAAHVPLPFVISATGSVSDLIAHIKGTQERLTASEAECSSLRQRLDEATAKPTKTEGRTP